MEEYYNGAAAPNDIEICALQTDDPFRALVWKFSETEESIAALPRRPVQLSHFLDDNECEWSLQDREFDRDWFAGSPGRRYRRATAFVREAEAAGLVPLEDGHTALRLTRWEPDDAIPLSRELEVRKDDIERINSATDEELALLFDFDSDAPDATAFIVPRRCGPHYETDFDKRGYGSPLAIVSNPPRKIQLGRPASKPFGECSTLLNLTEQNVKDLEPTNWLIEGELQEGSVCGLIAPGGSGKSARSLQMAVALARGEGSAMGLPAKKRRKTWVINFEDDPNQQRKRVAAICKLFGYRLRGLQGWLHIFDSDLGGTCLATRGKNGEPVEGPDVSAFVQYILDYEIGAVVLDPLIGLHRLNENDNGDMRFLFDVLKRVAKFTGAAIYVIHHSNKPGMASSEGRAGNAHSSRGASDIVNAQRAVLTLYNMSQEEAERWRVNPATAHRYVRIDDAKTNHVEISGRARWFEKVSVPLDNGEKLFALRPVQLGDGERTAKREALVTKLLTAAIGMATDGAGRPINFSPSAKARGDSNTANWLEAHGASEFSPDEIRATLSTLVERRVFRIEQYKNGGKLSERYAVA
jgi:hypothetical protein